MVFKKGTAAQWTSLNPTLSAGDIGYETDTGLRKYFNGTSAWNSLPYRSEGADFGPRRYGFSNWTFDPTMIFQGSGADSYLWLSGIEATDPLITNLHVSLFVSAVGGTAGENWAGLFDSSGTRIGVCADQTTNFGGATGKLTMPLVGGPVAVTVGKIYYVGITANGSGTDAAFAVGIGNSYGAAGIFPAAMPFRWMVDGSHYGTIHTSFPTTAGPSWGGGIMHWAAFS